VLAGLRAATADDAPETRSERMFTELEPGFTGTNIATGRRRGLRTAIAAVRQWRRDPRVSEDTHQGGIDGAWVSNGGGSRLVRRPARLTAGSSRR
jgi:hypothetical protein